MSEPKYVLKAETGHKVYLCPVENLFLNRGKIQVYGEVNLENGEIKFVVSEEDLIKLRQS